MAKVNVPYQHILHELFSPEAKRPYHNAFFAAGKSLEQMRHMYKRLWMECREWWEGDYTSFDSTQVPDALDFTLWFQEIEIPFSGDFWSRTLHLCPTN